MVVRSRVIAATCTVKPHEPGAIPGDVERQKTTKSIRFAKKVSTIRFTVPPETRMTAYIAGRRKHSGPAEMPTKEQLKVALKIARNRARRLQAQVGSGGRMCMPVAASDDSLYANRE